jgi:hypothetical protein
MILNQRCIQLAQGESAAYTLPEVSVADGFGREELRGGRG